jgi:hypothetical protein
MLRCRSMTSSSSASIAGAMSLKPWPHGIRRRPVPGFCRCPCLPMPQSRAVELAQQIGDAPAVVCEPENRVGCPELDDLHRDDGRDRSSGQARRADALLVPLAVAVIAGAEVAVAVVLQKVFRLPDERPDLRFFSSATHDKRGEVDHRRHIQRQIDLFLFCEVRRARTRHPFFARDQGRDRRDALVEDTGCGISALRPASAPPCRRWP